MHSLLRLDTHYPIYCDPSRKLYEKLGMATGLQGAPEGQKVDYQRKGSIANAVGSIKNAVTSGTDMVKGGHPSQNGGEMLWMGGTQGEVGGREGEGKGGKAELVWFKRMRHTQDHADVSELKEILGLE